MKNNSKIIDLNKKRVLVIGGSGILGRSIAQGFEREGAQVAISGTSEGKTTAVAKEVGNNILPLVIDACSSESLEQAAAYLQDTWGGLDILVNAAGGNKPGATVMPDDSFFDVNVNEIEQVVKLNLFGGGILPIKVFGQMMKEQKTPVSIINISSMAASQPLTRVMGYSASKAAIDNLTRWLAVEFATKYGRHIRVNAIAPGFFLTDQNRFLLTDEKTGNLSERGQQIIDNTPMKDFGKPEDLQGACLWLASEAANFVTGTVIPVDGGFSAFSGV